ncbi:hypothetical protein [Methylobacillus flagellatus]|nr:hypothetical protein [Methylobacillus flagellatus]
MKQFLLATALGSIFAMLAWAEEAPSPQHATTANGERVILNEDGSWQYADQEKTQPRQSVRDCPPGSQGGWFGTRCIPPGDKDFNRGSLSRKGR